MTTLNVDVLIVGAGPTGLTLACSLVRAGVSVHLIDKRTERSPHSRALVVHPRSQEIFNQLGIAEGLITHGNKTTTARFFVKRKLAARVPVFESGYRGCRFSEPLFVEQTRTEHALEAGLDTLGGEVQFAHELLSYTEHTHGVSARCRSDADYTVECRYIVGCDGAHSAVRHCANIPFEGAPYEQDFILADLDITWDQPRDSFMAFSDRDGFMALFPLRDRFRLIAGRGRYSEGAPDPTLDDFRDVFTRLVPYEATLSNPVWLTRFRLHHRVAQRFRQQRTMLAGDAAHIHSPVGGQGMNTGIQDAWNLGWKLAWALRAPQFADALLESYHEERRPVGVALLRTTDRAFNFVSGQSALARSVRSRIAPWAIPLGASIPPLRNAARYRITQLGIHYRGSRLCDAGGGAPKPGDRMPDIDVDGASLHAQLDPVRATVLSVGPTAAHDPRWKSLHLPEPTQEQRALLGTHRAEEHLLIRPDAHLAARVRSAQEVARTRLMGLAP